MKKITKGWQVLSDGTLVRPNGKHVPKDSPCSNGYLQVSVSYKGVRKMLKQHRVAYFLRTGEQPEMIDHINGNKADNSENNLRGSDRVRNQRNQYRHREGSCGITLRSIGGKSYYRIRLRANGKQYERSATTIEQAEAILADMKRAYWNA